MVLTEYGAGYVINSNWFKFNKQEQGELIFTLLIVGAVMTLIVMTIFGFITDIVFPLIATDNWVFIKPILPFLFIAVFSMIPMTIFDFWVVIEQKAILNSFVKGFQIIFGAFTTVFIAIFTQNYQYIIIGTVLVSFSLAVIQLFFLLRIVRVRFDKRYFNLIYKISSPIFLRSVFNHIRMQFDKIIVVRMFGAGQFALYNFAGKTNNMFNEFSINYEKAYQPSIFKGLTNENLDLKNMRTMFFAWGYISLLFCSFLIVFGKYLIDIFTNGIFSDAFPLVLLYTSILAIKLPFLGCGEVIIFYQKTKYLLFVTILQAFITILFALILIPIYGAAGGIFTLWLGWFFMFIMFFLKKQCIYNQWFIEKQMFPYVIIFHIIVLLKYFEIGTATNFFLLAFIGVMSFHFFIMNRAFIERMFLRIRLRFVSAFNQKKY